MTTSHIAVPVDVVVLYTQPGQVDQERLRASLYELHEAIAQRFPHVDRVWSVEALAERASRAPDQGRYLTRVVRITEYINSLSASELNTIAHFFSARRTKTGLRPWLQFVANGLAVDAPAKIARLGLERILVRSTHSPGQLLVRSGHVTNGPNSVPQRHTYMSIAGQVAS